MPANAALYREAQAGATARELAAMCGMGAVLLCVISGCC